MLGVLLGLTITVPAAAQEYESLADDCQQCASWDRDCPQSPSRWELNATLLYLRPGSGNLEYGMLASPLPIPTPNWAGQSVMPGYSPALSVGVRYLVPDFRWDFQANWTHLDASSSASVAANSNQFVGPNYEIGPDASLFRFGAGEAVFQYDSINLDAGQFFSACGPFRVRAFGGLQYARISQTLAANFRSENGLITNGNVTDSDFNGLGPRLGMKAEVNAGPFHFLGEIGGSLLVGQSKSRIDFSATSPALVGLGVTPPNTQSLTSPDATQVVQSIDTKLGAGYTYYFRGRGRLKFEAGYQAAVYINAINQYSLSEVVTPPVDQSVGVYLRTAEHTQSDFTTHGPYFTGSWEF
jgi:hypothetical protein